VSGFVSISKRVVPTARLLAGVIALAVAVVVAIGVSPGRAFAGKYHVYSCRTPDGEVAPTEGWSGSTTVSGAGTYAEDTCPEGGALIAAFGDQTIHTAAMDRATWSFETPPGDRLAYATLWRAGYLHGKPEEAAFYQLWVDAPIGTKLVESCLLVGDCSRVGKVGEPLSSVNELVIPQADLGSELGINVECATYEGAGDCAGAFSDPNGYAAVMYLYAADLILEQTAAPTASNIGGELSTAQTVSGTSNLTFAAHDPGSGVYEAVFSVDGRVVQSTVLDEDGGSCRNVGETTDGLPAFLSVQPCPALVNANVGLDTTAIANGTHQLEVSVTDAAGNAVKVLERTITVDNQPQPGGSSPQGGGPNGTHASAQATLTVGWKGAKGRRLSSGFGHAHTLVGQVTGVGGVPIEGAKIGVLATPAYVGAKAAAMASPVTGREGRFSVVLPAGVSSRTLRLSYSPTLGGQPVATRTLTLSVRAGVSLRIAPRTASVGRSIYFSGHLRGGPLPKGGAPLVLEARSPGGAWLEFDVVRSGAGGGYHASYAFKFPGPEQYQFRVLCEAQADYPFATGASPVVGVFER
jgi:hypothetical protein